MKGEQNKKISTLLIMKNENLEMKNELESFTKNTLYVFDDSNKYIGMYLYIDKCIARECKFKDRMRGIHHMITLLPRYQQRTKLLVFYFYHFAEERHDVGFNSKKKEEKERTFGGEGVFGERK